MGKQNLAVLQQVAGERVAQGQGAAGLLVRSNGRISVLGPRTRPHEELVSELRDGLPHGMSESPLGRHIGFAGCLIAEPRALTAAILLHLLERKTAGLEKAMARVSETIEKKPTGERDAMIDAMAKQIARPTDQAGAPATAEFHDAAHPPLHNRNVRAEKTPPGFCRPARSERI